jgi:hypothetical protein
MDKLDFRKAEAALYRAPKDSWARVEVPERLFLGIDGAGDPNGPGYAEALAALYPVAYAIKFAAKAQGADFAVPPLEALWWSEDRGAFVRGDRSAWRWTALLRVPDATEPEALDSARGSVAAKAGRKPGGAPARLGDLRLVRLTEGDCLQRLHVGPYADEAPVLAELHDRVMPEAGLTFAGAHHEVYLSDARRVAPERLRTILRQPVRPG